MRRLAARSADGARVPLTVLHTAGAALDGSAPCLLVVYGAYGHCLPTDYAPERLPLLRVRDAPPLGRGCGGAGHARARVQRAWVQPLQPHLEAL